MNMEDFYKEQRLVWDVQYQMKGIMWRGIPGKELEVSEDSRILDLGCGNGKVLSSLIGKAVSITGIDFSRKAIELCRRLMEKEDVNLAVADARSLPFRGESFDVVIAHHLLEHLPLNGRRKAVSEIRRILKPNGVVIVSVLSIADMRFGAGREIEENTFVKGTSIATHYFTTAELKEIFSGFQELNVREEIEEKLYSGDPVRRATIRGEFVSRSQV